MFPSETQNVCVRVYVHVCVCTCMHIVYSTHTLWFSHLVKTPFDLRCYEFGHYTVYGLRNTSLASNYNEQCTYIYIFCVCSFSNMKNSNMNFTISLLELEFLY